MGSPEICSFCHKNRNFIISLFILLLSSSKLIQLVSAIQREGFEEKKMMIRTQVIGSTPPRCERRCSSCGHCEAVQVPVTTRILTHKSIDDHHLFTSISNIAYSRGDGISNYKPMSWKCKCGNLIFNP